MFRVRVRFDRFNVRVRVVLCRWSPTTDDRLDCLQSMLALVGLQQLAKCANPIFRRVEPAESRLDGLVDLDLTLPIVDWVVVDVAWIVVPDPASY